MDQNWPAGFFINFSWPLPHATLGTKTSTFQAKYAGNTRMIVWEGVRNGCAQSSFTFPISYLLSKCGAIPLLSTELRWLRLTCRACALSRDFGSHCLQWCKIGSLVVYACIKMVKLQNKAFQRISIAYTVCYFLSKIHVHEIFYNDIEWSFYNCHFV